jgi:hypothetical protein
VNVANGDAQSHQARLALAQQQLQGAQQGILRGGTNPDGTTSGGSVAGANAEAMLRQVSSPASHPRTRLKNSCMPCKHRAHDKGISQRWDTRR